MKRFFNIILALGMTASLSAQSFSKHFVINGNIEGLPTETTEMMLSGVLNGKAFNDTVPVVNGRFVFQGDAEPAKVRIYCQRIGKPHYVNPIEMYVDGGNIQLTAVYDTTQYTYYRDVKIVGSNAQDEHVRYNDALRQMADEVGADAIAKEYQEAEKAKDTVRIKAAMEKYKAVDAAYMKYMSNYIRTNNKSFVALGLISNYSRQAGEYVDSAKVWYESMSDEIKSSASGKSVAEKIAYTLKGQLIGKQAPDFEQSTPDGKKVRLSDYKGKYLLLDFWASWCGPCRAENPNVLKAYNQYHDKGLEILAVSLDTDRERWVKAIKEDALPWTHVSDLQRKNSIANQFGISGIPDNFLIAPDGTVIARGLRDQSLFDKLKEVMDK